MKVLVWIAFLVLQLIFVVAGLALFFLTINTWEEGRKLDAIFEGGLGAYAFLLCWRLVRSWVRQNMDLIRRLMGRPAEVE